MSVLHAESVQRTVARRPLVVGDRLDTDIEGACRVGADSLLVLTGVTQPADLLLAPPGRRPVLCRRGPVRAAGAAPGGDGRAAAGTTAAAGPRGGTPTASGSS